MKFWICIPMETSACLIRMSAIAMSLVRSAASALFREFSASPSSAPSFFAFAIIVEPGPRRFDRDVEALRLRDDLIERLDLVHGALNDLFALRLEEPFLQVALQAVDFLQVVGVRGFLRVGPEFLELPSRDSHGKPVLDDRVER